MPDTALSGLDAPVRALMERIAAPAAAATPDLAGIGAALATLAEDTDYLGRWAARLGDGTGRAGIHLPARGPRLMIVHRPLGQMSAVHDHGTWVAIGAISGLETHRRYRVTGEGAAARPEVAAVDSLGPAETATLLPPDDLHDHGHLVGRGSPAHILVLTGDDQLRFERTEWDPDTGRRRILPPGEPGRWFASDPWPRS